MFKFLFNPYKAKAEAIARSRAEMREYAVQKGWVAPDEPLEEPFILDAEGAKAMSEAIRKSREEIRKIFVENGWAATL